MIRKWGLSVSLIASLVSFYLFYQLYFKWNFSENGVSFDPIEGVSYSENSFIWGVLGAGFFILAFILKFKKT